MPFRVVYLVPGDEEPTQQLFDSYENASEFANRAIQAGWYVISIDRVARVRIRIERQKLKRAMQAIDVRYTVDKEVSHLAFSAVQQIARELAAKQLPEKQNYFVEHYSGNLYVVGPDSKKFLQKLKERVREAICYAISSQGYEVIEV